MAGNDYLVPFGIDPRKFFEGLNAMDEGTDKLAANVKSAGVDMQKSFEGAATAGDTFGKKLDMTAAKAQELRDKSRAVGKDIGDALSGKNVGAGLEERVNKIKSTLAGTTGKKVEIGFDFDEAKLELLNKMVEDGADEFKVLAQVIDFAKQKLSGLDPQSEDWQALNAQIKESEGLLKAFGVGEDGVATSSKSLKAQLRAMKEELALMETQGRENTAEFLKLSVAAGKVEDQIGDISQRVRVLASDTKYIDAGVQAVTALAGGFAAAQGAAALFGSENEEITKVIQKVTGAMAILQGIQAIATALNKDSTLSVLLFSRAQTTAAVTTEALAVAEGEQAVATTAATVATRSWTAALLTNPIFLIIAGLAALVAALYAFSSGSDDAKKAADELNETLDRQNKLLKLDEGAINRRTSLLVAQAKLQGKSEADITAIEGQGLADRVNLQIENLNETRRLLSDRNFINNLKTEELKKLQDKELEQAEAVENGKNELRIKGIEQQIQRNKAEKDAETKRLENSKKSAAEQKALIEQEIKFRKQFSGAFIDTITDQYEKEKQQAIANTQTQIDELNKEKALSAAAERERADIILLLRQNLSAKLNEIDHKRESDRAQLLLDGANKLAELQADGANKEVEVLHLSYLQKAKEIKEQFKNEGELRKQLLAALQAKEVEETKKIRDKAAQDALNDAQERAVLEVELASKFVGDFPKIEEQKQIEILKVKLDFAVRNLNLLRKQGADENSLEVLQARKLVNDIENELGDAAKKLNEGTGGFDMFKALGLGDLTEKQKKDVTDAARQSLDNVRQITDFISDQYERQIKAKQKVIDADNKAVDNLQNQLDKEKQLRAEGLANNVDIIEGELAAKKNQRDKDIKDQEELQKKQQAIQKAQIALDSATQASSLITASSKIFNALSGIPFVGVPLAITTIALMVGAFITAKVKALQAVGSGEKFGGGGWIEKDKPHSKGGKKYIATDGSGDVKELESGEHVTRKTQAEKYADLLDAINSDSLEGMTDDALRAMLHEMGIHLNSDEPGEALDVVRERDALQHEITLKQAGPDIGADVKTIREGVEYLAKRKKADPERWEENGFIFEKIGTVTTKLKKDATR
jgi:hypothetical protein